MWRYSGIFLWATGILHCAVGIVIGMESWQGIVQGGVVNAVGEDLGMSLAFWFFMGGIPIILAGLLMQHLIRVTQKPAPRFTAWWMLAFAVAACAVVPVSGGWLFLPQAWIIFAANRSKK